MERFVLPLAEIEPGSDRLVGGKAAALGALARAGFPVPPGFCITTEAFAAALAPLGAAVGAVGVAADTPLTAQPDRLAALQVPDAVAAAVRAALLDSALGGPLAVRSSATAEDRGDVSFAGQYDTVLGVRGEEAVLAAVLTCWRSFFSPHAVAARAAAGATGDDEAMALVVQRVVEAECAGVAFSVDPVRLRRDTVVVDAVWGLGAGAVDGSVPADTYRVSRATFDLDERRVVEKPREIVLAPDGGTEERAVADGRARAACLPDAWVQRVAQFAVAAEQAFARPQDIEWAVAGGRVWLLQSRPITSLPADLAAARPFPVDWPAGADRRAFWEREWWVGPVPRLPLDNDAAELINASRRESAHLKGEDVYHQYEVFDGRRYYRMTPTALREGDRQVRKAAYRDLVARVTASGATMWDYWAPEVVAATGRLAAVDPAALDGPALAAHLEAAFGCLLRHWTVHWCQGMLEGRFLQTDALPAAVERATGLTGPAAEAVALRLADGEETAFTRLVNGLHDLAVAARAHPRLAGLVADPPPDVVAGLAAMPEAAEFRDRLARFLAAYGDRSGTGFGSGASTLRPTWRDDPSLVLAMVAPYLDEAVESPAVARARALAARDALLEELLAASPPEAAAELARVVPLARRQRTALEDHNHYIDQMSWGQLRRAILAAGQRLAAQGALSTPDDVFWLRRDEVNLALRAGVPTSWEEAIAARRAQHEAWCALESPLYLGMPPSTLPPRPPLTDAVTAAAADAGGRLVGIGASPGTHRGRARVVPMGTLLPDVGPGEVLVAVNAGPLWTPVFPILGALVLDQGAPLLHAATTAREFGVPAVLGTGSATRRIADGDWVLVDGTAGTVDLVDGPG